MASLPTCCKPWQRQCQKLRVVVVTTKPWGVPVGGTPTAVPIVFPDQPPQSGMVALGLPGPVRLSGTPVAIPAPATSLPADLLVKYSAWNLAVLAFDFSNLQLCTGAVGGTVIARGIANCTQASLTFAYNWCGQEDTCVADPPDRWSVTACTHNGMQFSVIDDSTYISANPCLDSIVILGLQQYCCAPGDVCAESSCTYKVLPCLAQRVSGECPEAAIPKGMQAPY